MGQGGVGVLAQEDCLLGLALVPVEYDAVPVGGHPRYSRDWCIVLRLLSPMVGSKEYSLERWHIEQILYPDGVYLSVIIFQPEIECSNSVDGNAQSFPSTWWSPSMSLRLLSNWSVRFSMQYDACPSTPIRYESESKCTNVRWLPWCMPWSSVSWTPCLV